MSSVDVIELGSSDEEVEPAPKKKKCPANIMVKIPPNLSEVTITPSKNVSKINPVSLGKAITVTKVPKSNILANPYANKNKFNGKNLRMQPPNKIQKNLAIPIMSRQVKKACVNPQLIPIVGKHIIQSQTKPLNMINTSNVLNPVSVRNVSKPSMIPIGKVSHIPGKSPSIAQQPIAKLPPGLTITKTLGAKKNSPPNRSKPLMKRPRQMTNEVLTVDLDDDEPQTSTGQGPQWYLRPEDPNRSMESAKTIEKSPEKEAETVLENDSNKSANNKTKESPEKSETEKQPEVSDQSSLEKENNKEPDKTNFIEITIEDSPIKPLSSKQAFKVGAELAITIDDSPIKNTDDKSPSGSDEEVTEKVKKPHSKKKLKYPKKVEHKVIEIEIEPFQPETGPSKEIEKAIKPSEITRIVSDVIEIEESPHKTVETEQVTPKKRKMQPSVKMADFKYLDDKEKEEFHPAYQAFIKLCFQLENSEDMKKIVEKKIKSYYRQVPKDYTESEMFVEIVLSKTTAMKAAPEKMYLYIKDIVDELDVQRKIAKKQAEEIKEEQNKFLYGEESEFDSKRQRQIRKLEKTLKKLHRAIQKLEEQEVDFDDEEDSVYLLTERYKERMVRVHAKLCQLTNTKMPSEPRIQIDARPGQPKGPAKRLEKWVNKKVPIGTPLPFPDFHDVLRCVRDANQQDKLGWNEVDIMEEARDLFTRCGKKLQRRRQENEWRLAASRIQTVGDPAEKSEDLKKKLEDNKRVAAKRETEVLNKYADRQKQLKLEAEEIGDKEAEESPEESDDEVLEDNESLENKQNRKERLKRLIQEKSRQSTVRREQIEETSLQDSTEVSKEGANAEINDKKHNQSNDNECPPAKRAKIMRDSGESDTKRNDQKEINSKNSRESINNGDESDKSAKSDKIHSLSDDSSKVESDIDELHLLQKLHSGNEHNSSTSESDSDSPIAISDESMSSDSREHEKPSSDVISIENSSYSESEEKKDTEEIVSHGLLYIEEIQEDDEDSKTANETSNENGLEVNNIDSEEALLLSDDTYKQAENNPKEITSDTESRVNLRDDNNSIDETEIGKIHDMPDDANKVEGNEVTNLDALDTETCVNLRDDNISIDETVISDAHNFSSDTIKKAGDGIINPDLMDTETCVNLRDENISIDSSLGDANKEADDITNEPNLNTETCTNLRDDNISIHETEIGDNLSPDDASKEVSDEISNEANLDTEKSKNFKDNNISNDESDIFNSTGDVNTKTKTNKVNLDGETRGNLLEVSSSQESAIINSNSPKEDNVCNKNGNTDSMEGMDKQQNTDVDKSKPKVTSSVDKELSETSVKNIEADSCEKLKENVITTESGDDKKNVMDTTNKTDIGNHKGVVDKSSETMEVDLNIT